MLVDGSEGEGLGRLGRGQPVEPVLEDGVDVAVGANADGQGPGTGGLAADRAVAAAEAKMLGSADHIECDRVLQELTGETSTCRTVVLLVSAANVAAAVGAYRIPRR